MATTALQRLSPAFLRVMRADKLARSACRYPRSTAAVAAAAAAVATNLNGTASVSDDFGVGILGTPSSRNLTGSSGAAGEGGGGTEGGRVGSTLSFRTIVDGKPILPKEFKGKAVLVVNTASLCGLTPQLKELELVHKRFRESGLVVLGVPSNDFGEQEPWEEEKIKEFYEKDFGVTFPLTSKTVVIGPGAHPLYSAVTAEFGDDAGPRWNFHKLLVDADGVLAGVFGSHLSPLDPEATEAIEEALPSTKKPA